MCHYIMMKAGCLRLETQQIRHIHHISITNTITVNNNSVLHRYISHKSGVVYISVKKTQLEKGDSMKLQI